MRGLTGNLPDVNDDHQTLVAGVFESDLEFRSEEKGKAFSWTSTYAATAAQEVISIKNTSQTEILTIDYVGAGNSVASAFTLFAVTSGTAAGSAITGKPMNVSKGGTASATAFGGASVTGSLAGDTLGYTTVVAGATEEIPVLAAVVLGQNDEIAITASATGTVHVTVIGHYKPKPN